MDSIWWNIINNLQSYSSKSKNELFNHSCYNHLPHWINLSWQHRLEQTFQQCQQPQKKWHERPWLQRTNAPTFQQQRPTCPTKISPIPPISKTININTKHQKHQIPTKSCPNDNCSIEPVLLYCANNQINHYKISTIRLFFYHGGPSGLLGRQHVHVCSSGFGDVKERIALDVTMKKYSSVI